MKNFKNLFLILFTSLFVFTSCENEDVLVEPQQETEESPTLVSALSMMKSNFDESGNVTQSSNPAGNIIFDFCFDFVYPITLSYNTGATVNVNSLDDLINVIINSTDQLFIDGINFPFDVETYDSAANAVVVQTINNESDFENLMNNCEFEDDTGCDGCFQVYDPVCVEITDPSGETFIISYPNECEALCDGFTSADFVEDCVDTNYFDFGFGCFTLNFPIELILDDGSTITINNDTEFANAMYNQYIANFVYPLSITLTEDNSEVIVNNEAEFEAVFVSCFAGAFDCTECEEAPMIPVCVEFTDANGNTVIETYPNLCFAECIGGFTEADVVDCDNTNPTDSCTDDAIFEALVNCNVWNSDISGIPFLYNFDIETNSVEILDDSGNVVQTGTWSISVEPSTGIAQLIIDVQSGNFFDIWYFFGCNSPDGINVVSEQSFTSNIEPACD